MNVPETLRRVGLRRTVSFICSEPLVHFVVLAALLFAVYGMIDSRRPTPQESRRVTVTAGDLQHLREGFAAQWRREPTPQELQHLVVDHVHEEVLAREATAMGLAQGDAIVRRRLAQKAEFVLQEVASARDPTPQELAAYRARNASRYDALPRVSFAQIYFSSAKRGSQARADASRALERLRKSNGDALAEGMGDPSLLEAELNDQDEAAVRASFGAVFASSVIGLDGGEWHGPVASSYGWHLVKLRSRSRPDDATLAETERRVLSDWRDEERRAVAARAMKQLLARYEIVLEEGVRREGIASPGEVDP